jgi:hypothetical protein
VAILAVQAGSTGLDREAAAERELLELKMEKIAKQGAVAAAEQEARPKSLQSMEADEEFKQMHPAVVSHGSGRLA